MYHYTTCGLENIHLKNGYALKETTHGPAVSIKDIEGLHLAISRNLLGQETPLIGRQFRFLRKEQDLTTGVLAEIFGVTVQTIVAWEMLKDTPVPEMADISMRAYCLAHCQINGMKQTFPSRKDAQLEPAIFAHDDSEWRPIAG